MTVLHGGVGEGGEGDVWGRRGTCGVERCVYVWRNCFSINFDFDSVLILKFSFVQVKGFLMMFFPIEYESVILGPSGLFRDY